MYMYVYFDIVCMVTFYIQDSQECSQLSLSVLRGKITTVPHVKPRGRPKHTGTLWPSKKKKKSLKRPRIPVEDKEKKI